MVLAGCAQGAISRFDTLASKETLEAAHQGGNAIVFAEVSLFGERCRSGGINVVHKGKHKEYGILTDRRGFAIGGVSPVGFQSLPPGSYWVNHISCGRRYVDLNVESPGLFKNRDLSKVNAKAPQFKVEAGEIVHIGTIKISKFGKAALFTSQRVMISVGPTDRKTKAALKKKYADLYPKIKFRPATSVASLILAGKLLKLLKKVKGAKARAKEKSQESNPSNATAQNASNNAVVSGEQDRAP